MNVFILNPKKVVHKNNPDESALIEKMRHNGLNGWHATYKSGCNEYYKAAFDTEIRTKAETGKKAVFIFTIKTENHDMERIKKTVWFCRLLRGIRKAPGTVEMI